MAVLQITIANFVETRFLFKKYAGLDISEKV